MRTQNSPIVVAAVLLIAGSATVVCIGLNGGEERPRINLGLRSDLPARMDSDTLRSQVRVDAPRAVLGLDDEPPIGPQAPSGSVALVGHDAALSDEERWEKRYADSSVGQIIDKCNELQALVSAVAQPYFETSFAAGRYQTRFVARDERGARTMPVQPGVLTHLKCSADGDVRYVELPRDEFEKTYALFDELEWLRDRKDELDPPRPHHPWERNPELLKTALADDRQ